MRIIVWALVGGVTGAVVTMLYLGHLAPTSKNPPAVQHPAVSREKTTPISSRSVFVPYWSEFEALQGDYNRYIYFGITPTSAGINEYEPGYQKLESFVAAVPISSKKLLTLRITDKDQALRIVRNKGVWDAIVTRTLDIADSYKFDGVVLDLEIGALPLSDVSSEITDFVNYFYTNTKGRNLHFAITIYGDTIYRHRPYDLAALSKYADEVMVMAYDFHKAQGEPGPNFPLNGRETYGYDFTTMVSDFASAVPPSKLTVIFGMFGYDWQVNEDKKPFGPATGRGVAEIKKTYVDKCVPEDCVMTRDKLSAETEINFVDNKAFAQPNIVAMHIVWYDDERSVAAKLKVLEKKGIGKIAYWAWGYF